MVDRRVFHKRTVVDLHDVGVAVNRAAGIGTVAKERAAFNRCRPAVEIKCPTPQGSRIGIECAFTDGKDGRVGIGNRAASKECEVTLELTLCNLSRALYTDKDRPTCSIGRVRSGSV